MSQVSFITDDTLKAKVLQKTKEEGITLKALLTFCMRAYAEGKLQLGISVKDPQVEELHFSDQDIQDKAAKLHSLL